MSRSGPGTMGHCQGPLANQRLGPWVLHNFPAAAGFCALHMGCQASGEARPRARPQRHQGLIAPHIERRVQSRAYKKRESVTPPQAAEPPVFATLYASIYETDPAHHLRCRDFEEFAALLREVWEGEISGKGATAKFVPADLDPGHSEAASR